MEYRKIAEEELIESICDKCFVGKGGNGSVYKIYDTKYVLKKINLRFNKSGKLSRPNEKKKYTRFRDEISVVVSNQEKIPGILPIFQHSTLPEKVSKDTLLYYIMPYATSLDKVSFSGFDKIVQCFQSLFSSLAVLHENKIAHRDIKPSNIYKHNSKFVFGDFGLVHYPDKKEISKDERRIGPWATIAPEMERQPFVANPFPADVYSLAKTMWIILTGNSMSFEGQYNYLDVSVSLNNHVTLDRDFYLGILHEVLRRCTSNLPAERPTAKEVAVQLATWLSGHTGQLSKVEWDLLLREIVTSRPKKIIWDDSKEIGRILNLVGKTRGLNHTFLPNRGGFDLHGAKAYSNNKVELDFGYKVVVKPKLLFLNLYEDAQWNHFYLETDKFLLPNNGNGEPYSGNAIDEYLQIDEDTYVERWKVNYREYNGFQIPKNAQLVFINHNGNYVIFPKISFYNLELDKIRLENDQEKYVFDPYDGLHEKLGSEENFASFIEILKAFPTGENGSTLLKLARDYGRNITWKLPDPIQGKKREEIYRCLEAHDFRLLIEDSKTPFVPNGNLEFELNLKVGNFLHLYFLNVEYRLVKKQTGFNLSTLFQNLQKENTENTLFIKGFDRAINKVEILKEAVLKLADDVSKDIQIDFWIESKRTVRLAHTVHEKDSIIYVLSQGNDDKGGVLVLGENGELKLVELDQFSRAFCPYSAQLFKFDPHMNILGSNSGDRLDKFVHNHYRYFLSITFRHLRTGRFVDFPGDAEFHDIEKLKDLIVLENEKYAESRG